MGAYRLTRVIGIDGCYSGSITATQGITAGSGFATTELRVLLTELIYQVKRAWPVSLKLYVDDLTIAAHGQPRQAADAVAQATNLAIDQFTKLRLKVSPKKSSTIASSDRAIHEHHVVAPPNLGTSTRRPRTC